MLNNDRHKVLQHTQRLQANRKERNIAPCDKVKNNKSRNKIKLGNSNNKKKDKKVRKKKKHK